MDLARLLIRMALWVRRPPSRQFLVMATVVVAVSLAIGVLERVFGWPEWLTVRQLPRWPGPQ